MQMYIFFQIKFTNFDKRRILTFREAERNGLILVYIFLHISLFFHFLFIHIFYNNFKFIEYILE